MAPPRPIRPLHQSSLARQHHADLPVHPRAVAEARRLVRDAVRSWDVAIDAEIAVLLASELVTNAVTHGSNWPASTIALTVADDQGCLRVEVYDTSSSLPVVHEDPLAWKEDEGEHGRGMFLIDRLATTWGCHPTASGKVVYFTLKS